MTRDVANDAAPGGPQNTEQPQGSMSRRGLLMAGTALAASNLASPISRAAAQVTTGMKPNIVFILADDLGWKDVGFHGSDIKTPNIDKLAETGARLEEYYVQPMCTPTRAAFMTGRYPFRYGLQTAVIPSGGKYGLATDEWLLPQALKQAGYQTAIMGKWHLGHADRKYWPSQRGFDYSYGPLIGEIDHFKHEIARCGGLVPEQQAGQGARLRHHVVWSGCGSADQHARCEDAAAPLLGFHRPAHALSGAAKVPRHVRRHRRPVAPRLRGPDHGHGRRDRQCDRRS